MKTFIFLSLSIFALASPGVQAGPRSSADYSIPTESMDGGGTVVSSANYSIKGSSAGLIAALTSASSPSTTNKAGYIGQLYDIVGLSITLPPSNNLNEAASGQLNAAPLADDTTTLAPLNPATVSWSIVGGPINSISQFGVATAGNVYQNTLATVGGTAQSLSGQSNVTILNVANDNYGAYAGDQIDDSWQVQYFGLPPNPLAGPNADADGTGQTNLFKFVAGLNPLDGSRFALTIQNLIAQPTQRNVIFDPLVSGRTYTVQFTPTLINPSSWTTLTGTTQSDNGNQRTVTDLNAAAAPKFYRVLITRP